MKPEGESVNPHTIADHEGIVGVTPLGDGERIAITFDPARLSEADVRRIAQEHIQPSAPGLRRCALRLDGMGCEAAAAKLERRVKKVPGVRRATASYVGRVLCLTFDSSVASEPSVLEGARRAGAKIEPLDARKVGVRTSIRQRLLSGQLNEELSCAAGLLFLVVAWIVDRDPTADVLANWLYAGAYIFCGQYGVRSAVASLRELTLDVDVLMVLAALGAAVVGAPFEGALLLFLFSVSNVLQNYALQRTQRAIESLLTLRPDHAMKKTDGGLEEVAVDLLVPGDVVVVRPGELLPVDGLVVEGASSVNQSSLTGESMPVSKTVGATVFAGTLNESGGLEIVVTKKVEDSTLARMVKLVAEAQAEKSRAQRFLEKAEQGYAAGVIAFTVLVLLVPWLGSGEAFATAFYRAMTVMVVASPCALVISTPATVLSAIGGAARRGILIKGGAHLEQAARVDIVAVDKTGTLTVGRPTVTDFVLPQGVIPFSDGLPPEAMKLLAICAALESKSEHPLAAAIVAGANRLRLSLPVATAFRSTPGKGAEATIEGTGFVVGSERFFVELDAEDRDRFAEASVSLQGKGRTCVWMGDRRGDSVHVRAVFALADTLRPEAREVVARLRARGVRKIVMLTGDQSTVAKAIAAEAGIDEVRAELLPEAKVRAIRDLKSEGVVMMVGDGVNDAPALAAAHLGVAMGAAGTDVAMETADVVLMGDKLENIPLLLGMARHARRVLVQNLTFAAAVIVVLVASALGLGLPLPLGVIGHEGSTVLVCLNGLRLLVYRESAKASGSAGAVS